MAENKGKRTYVARSDSSISTLQANIEKTFGLPEGSIRIVKPSGRAKRADASVQSLCDEWNS